MRATRILQAIDLIAMLLGCLIVMLCMPADDQRPPERDTGVEQTEPPPDVEMHMDLPVPLGAPQQEEPDEEALAEPDPTADEQQKDEVKTRKARKRRKAKRTKAERETQAESEAREDAAADEKPEAQQKPEAEQETKPEQKEEADQEPEKKKEEKMEEATQKEQEDQADADGPPTDESAPETQQEASAEEDIGEEVEPEEGPDEAIPGAPDQDCILLSVPQALEFEVSADSRERLIGLNKAMTVRVLDAREAGTWILSAMAGPLSLADGEDALPGALVFVHPDGREEPVRSGDSIVVAQKPEGTAPGVTELYWPRGVGLHLRLEAHEGRPGARYTASITWTLDAS